MKTCGKGVAEITMEDLSVQSGEGSPGEVPGIPGDCRASDYNWICQRHRVQTVRAGNSREMLKCSGGHPREGE